MSRRFFSSAIRRHQRRLQASVRQARFCQYNAGRLDSKGILTLGCSATVRGMTTAFYAVRAIARAEGLRPPCENGAICRQRLQWSLGAKVSPLLAIGK